jgi:hypothetical protein
MNHQPFEEWLLNDKHLAPAEKRELDAHLRMCTHCIALAETGLALRSARVAAPAAGFTVRFQQRLAAQKIAERRRKLWGLIVLIVAGAALFGWLAAPFIYVVITSPVEWFTAVISYFLFVFTSLKAFGEAFVVLARVIPNFISPYMWMMLVSALAGLGLLGSISIWRFTRIPQGASV